MRVDKIIITLCILFICYSYIQAQVIDKYDSETIYLQLGKYVKNGNTYPIGFAGKNLKHEMTVSPEAMKVFEKFQKEGTWSFGLGILALGTAIGAATVEEESVKISLLALSLGAFIVSVPLSRSASKNFHKAIWLRNRDVLR